MIDLYLFNLVLSPVHLDFSREKSNHICSPQQFYILTDSLLFMNVVTEFNSERVLPSLCQWCAKCLD